MNDERLAFILRAPALVERVVRGSLREALRSRRYQSGALEIRTFANAALSELERIAGATPLDIDAFGRLELQNATVNAAGTFASSAVARRLFALPLERFRRHPEDVDCAIRDGAERVHLLRLELVTNATSRADLARTIERALSEAKRPFETTGVHLFSLRDGRLRSFGGARTRARNDARLRAPSDATQTA